VGRVPDVKLIDALDAVIENMAQYNKFVEVVEVLEADVAVSLSQKV